MFLLYNSNPETNKTLADNEFNHIIKSLRKKSGDIIHITDGNGYLFTCEITELKSKLLYYEIKEKRYYENKCKFTLIFAPTKMSSKNELIIEKCCELGVKDFHLVFTQNSERFKINVERLEKLIISSCKQSMNFNFPKIYIYSKLDKYLEVYIKNSNTQNILFHCNNNFKRKRLSEIPLNPQYHYNLYIGPEGDFDNLEIDKLVNLGFESTIISNNRLRTETAAIAVASYFSINNL